LIKMEQKKLATELLKHLEGLKVDSEIENWKYLGETDKAFGTPGGSWQGENGFEFQNISSSNKYILRSISGSKSFLVLESYQIPGQLYNMNLNDDKVYKYDGNNGLLYESYNLTAGLGSIKRKDVKEMFNRLGYTDNLIFRLEAANPDWEGLIKSILDWGPIREEVKNKLKEEKNHLKKDVLIPGNSPNESKPTLEDGCNPINQILYGPPGTGKTFYLKDRLFDKYIIKETSISHDKHFEETVTNLTWWQVIALALIEIGTSRVNDILDNRWVSKKASLSESKNVRATLWGTLQMHTVIESKNVAYTQRQTPFIFDKNE